MGLTLITAATLLPVTVAEAQAHCRVEGEDTYLTALITAATAHVERMLDISLLSRSWRLSLDAFTDAIELRRGPVTSVTSVTYYDTLGNLQTLSTAVYTVDLTSKPQWIVRTQGQSWPSLLDAVNGVRIDYVSGYATFPAEYTDLKHAILLLVGHWYANREAVNPGNMASEVPLAFTALMDPFRRLTV